VREKGEEKEGRKGGKGRRDGKAKGTAEEGAAPQSKI